MIILLLLRLLNILGWAEPNYPIETIPLYQNKCQVAWNLGYCPANLRSYLDWSGHKGGGVHTLGLEPRMVLNL
jgi:hypothetical protein